MCELMDAGRSPSEGSAPFYEHSIWQSKRSELLCDWLAPAYVQHGKGRDGCALWEKGKKRNFSWGRSKNFWVTLS